MIAAATAPAAPVAPAPHPMGHEINAFADAHHTLFWSGKALQRYRGPGVEPLEKIADAASMATKAIDLLSPFTTDADPKIAGIAAAAIGEAQAGVKLLTAAKAAFDQETPDHSLGFDLIHKAQAPLFAAADNVTWRDPVTGEW